MRSNTSGDIGFLEDERRLNVALTRAQLGRIIVGNEDTLCAKQANEQVQGEGEGPNRNPTQVPKYKAWDGAVKDRVRVTLPARSAN